MINSISSRPVALRKRPAEWQRVHAFAAAGLTKRCKKSGLLIMPGYDAIHDLVNAVDPALLATALNRWLLHNNDLLLPKTIAMNGKDLGGKDTLGAIISLCHHATGAPLAMVTYSGAKDDCERPVGPALLEQTADVLPNAVVTSDALPSQKKDGADHHHRRRPSLPRPQGQPTRPLSART